MSAIMYIIEGFLSEISGLPFIQLIASSRSWSSCALTAARDGRWSEKLLLSSVKANTKARTTRPIQNQRMKREAAFEYLCGLLLSRAVISFGSDLRTIISRNRTFASSSRLVFCRRHQHAEPDPGARCLLDLGGYVACVLSQQCSPFRLELSAVKRAGGIDNVKQPVPVLEFGLKLLIALMEIERIPVFALPEEVETERGKLRRGEGDHTGVQRAYAGFEVCCDFAIVRSMRQGPLHDHGIRQQQRGDGGCNCRPFAQAQQKQFRRGCGQIYDVQRQHHDDLRSGHRSYHEEESRKRNRSQHAERGFQGPRCFEEWQGTAGHQQHQCRISLAYVRGLLDLEQ